MSDVNGFLKSTPNSPPPLPPAKNSLGLNLKKKLKKTGTKTFISIIARQKVKSIQDHLNFYIISWQDRKYLNLIV